MTLVNYPFEQPTYSFGQKRLIATASNCSFLPQPTYEKSFRSAAPQPATQPLMPFFDIEQEKGMLSLKKSKLNKFFDALNQDAHAGSWFILRQTDRI